MEGSEFVFDYVHLFYYKCPKIDPNCGESFIGSADWKKQNKKATINLINKNNENAFNALWQSH